MAPGSGKMSLRFVPLRRSTNYHGWTAPIAPVLAAIYGQPMTWMKYRHRYAAIGASLLLVLLPGKPACGQESSGGTRSIEVGVSGDRMDRRDETISPGRYGGILWGAEVAYDGSFT